MISKIDLHLRLQRSDEHRSLGVVVVEHEGPRLAPHQEFACWAEGRRVGGQVTSIHARSGHLPHVYADEVPAEELVH